MAGAEELRPDEPIIALDELQSDEALRHPLKLATETIAEAFSDIPITLHLAKPGHGGDLVRALVALYRSQHRYEVLEAGDFKCVALVKEVPEVAEEAEEGEASAASTGPDVDTSRAAASANMESLRKQQQRGDTRGGSAAAVDGEQLRAAVEAGSLNRLLALGVPRLEAEMLVHMRPDRLESLERLHADLKQRQERYSQEHGPLLHIHFLAMLPGRQHAGLGSRLMQHLERMADAEHRTLYLEASTADSRRLYLMHGFKDIEQYNVDGQAGVLLYIMARPFGAKPLPASETDATGGKQGVAADAVPVPCEQ